MKHWNIHTSVTDSLEESTSRLQMIDACLILTSAEELKWYVQPLPGVVGIPASKHLRDPAALDNPEPDVMLPVPSSPSDHSCSCNRRPRIGVLPAYVLRLRWIFREWDGIKETLARNSIRWQRERILETLGQKRFNPPNLS